MKNTAHGPVKGKSKNIIFKWTNLLPVSSSSGSSCLKADKCWPTIGDKAVEICTQIG